eukprot:8225256-Pyramimonas_sp.AAC.1
MTVSTTEGLEARLNRRGRVNRTGWHGRDIERTLRASAGPAGNAWVRRYSRARQLLGAPALPPLFDEERTAH